MKRAPGGIHRELVNEISCPRSGPVSLTSELFWQYKKELIADIGQVKIENPVDEAEMVEINLGSTNKSRST